jgi:glycosyltransferase involved in cell wall biosynthesis
VRIAFLAVQFAEYSARLALALAERADVLLVLDGSLSDKECDPGLMDELRRKVTLVEYRYTGSASRALTFARVCLRVALFRPDVLHVQEQADRSTARIVRYLAPRYPMVLTVHDPKPHRGRDAVWAEQNRIHRDEMRASADIYHVHGAFCREELRSVVGDERPILDTMHGVILVPGQPERRAPDPRRILFFGRMEAYKGIEVLLDAADRLAADGIPFEVVLAGRGPELDRLRPRIADMPSVTVLEGFLTPAQAVAEFQKAAAVAVPYLDATQSGVVAAAIANGRPCVGSRVGGLVDALRDGATGLLVPPGDAVALAEALRRVLTDTALRETLATEAARAAGAAFAWSTVADTLIDAYRLAIAGGNPATRPVTS